MATQDPDDLKTRTECESLMRAAHVYRNRGDYAQAAVAVQQALKLCPSDLDARELAADIVFAHGDIEKATEHYKSILEADPSRSSAEEKYARAVVQVAEGKRQKDLLKEMLDHPERARSQARSPVLAAIISIAPGFGQIYCGEYLKGMVIFASWILSWFLCLQLVGPPGHLLSTPTVIFGSMATSIHLYALVNASSMAEKKEKHGADR